ncbi:hypothetical protein ABTO78_20580 [Acinetobacter baumannii]
MNVKNPTTLHPHTGGVILEIDHVEVQQVNGQCAWISPIYVV